MSVYIIAEAGVNHNGSLEVAKKMVDVAKEAGASCIKFQTFVSENIVSKYAEKAEYQQQQTDATESQLSMLKKLELTHNEFIELNNYCEQREIEFLSTAFDFESIEFLKGLGMEKWKIPSGDITNLPYLIKIAKLNKPVILSTGMCTLNEVELAINTLRDNGSGEITVLHCTTEYPTPYKDVNLLAMNTMKAEFGVSIGYSDHTTGIEVPIAAVALGATVIEKHFTLDRNMEGPDHKASLEPKELKEMVRAIRNIELAIGSDQKSPAESEIKNISIARKSIIALKNIKKGDIFTEENITVKRPGNGINPMRWFEVIGQKAVRDFNEDELIEL
ncbi:N-acetylneuraminate synthase [Robertmurraya korlensis]|uniref:N-acetylneuraminate synthase n=1 Tax=Robertmurraya korlensis TaxID=519977 RepID=UPI000824A28C|nr:N-acetylneuraminate synthase [Robertmurraya korlensis]